MWTNFMTELRELAWLVSIVFSLSIVSVLLALVLTSV